MGRWGRCGGCGYGEELLQRGARAFFSKPPDRELRVRSDLPQTHRLGEDPDTIFNNPENDGCKGFTIADMLIKAHYNEFYYNVTKSVLAQ